MKVDKSKQLNPVHASVYIEFNTTFCAFSFDGTATCACSFALEAKTFNKAFPVSLLVLKTNIFDTGFPKTVVLEIPKVTRSQ